MPRKRKKNSNTTTYIASILAILIVSILFFTGVLKVELGDNTNLNKPTITWDNQNNKQYYTNTIIEDNWNIIKIDYNIQWGYSHKIETQEDTFYAKSDKYSLNNFLNEDIDFSWEVIWFSNDDIPVLNITSINAQENVQTDEEEQTIEEQNKYVSTKWIIIDLKNTDFSVKELEGDIYIYQSITWETFTWEDLNISSINESMKISPYDCIDWSNLYDCDAFKDQAQTYKFNTTTNNNGVVFYKLPEINQYVVINQKYGYNVYPLDGSFLDIINYIDIENLQSKKEQVIKNTCRSSDIELTEILTKQESWNNYEIIWFDKNANKVSCKLTITWDSQMVWQLISISYLQEEEATSNVKIWNLNEEDYLVYESSGYSYKLYMPNYVKYNSNIVNEDFWVSWLDCKQSVNIADWKSWNLNDPNVKAFYCTTNLSKEQLQWFLTNYTIVQNNWKTLIIDSKQDSISWEISSNLHIY